MGTLLRYEEHVKKGLSFVSHSTYSWVPMNQEAMEKAFTENLGRKTKIEGGKHQPFLTTIGVGYDFHLSPKIHAGISAQGGLCTIPQKDSI